MATSTSRPPRKSVSWQDLGVGGALAVLQVSTTGQPFEVLKTHMAANRGDNLRMAVRKTSARGGFSGFYQGLIPWAWLEAATKGSILLLSAGETERRFLQSFPGRKTAAGVAGGMVGGLVQTYAVMGVTTTMKTVEVTRTKILQSGQKPPSTFRVCQDIYRKEGIRGLNKGVNAVALRQMTGWASRIGITRFNEGIVRSLTGKSPQDKLNGGEKIVSSICGGALSCWNQPLEVIRIEMQSAIPSTLHAGGHRPTILETGRYIVQQNGLSGLYRGITPRIMLAASATTFMVAGGDIGRDLLK